MEEKNFNIKKLHKEISDEILEREFQEYKQKLKLKNECSFCHFLFGLLCFSVTSYFIVKSKFSWKEFNRKEKLGHIFAILFTSTIAIYKFTYSVHVNEVKNYLIYEENKKLKNII